MDRAVPTEEPALARRRSPVPQTNQKGNAKMIRTLKAAFGLSLMAALTLIAVNAMSASAITSGHFTSDVSTTILDITEKTTEPEKSGHEIVLSALGDEVTCHKPTYTSSFTGTTTQALTVEAKYENCTNGNKEAVTVTMNGCDYTFTSRSTGHATTHFKCPNSETFAEVHGPTGTFTFTTQTPAGGATYTTVTEEGKHALTVNITASEITFTCHGLCAIFGTHPSQKASMTGAVTVTGTDANKNPVNITAT